MGKLLNKLKKTIFFLALYFFWFFLINFESGCSVDKLKSNFKYISPQKQRVQELCTLIFTDPYYQYISPSRKVRIKKIRTTSWGFWANFADGRSYRVPIQSNLNLGEDYYCTYQLDSKYCPSLNENNYECNWK